MVTELTIWANEFFQDSLFTERVAASLNNVLSSIMGPKALGIQVKNPDKYNFNTLDLVKTIASVFSGLQDYDHFIQDVVNDGRYDFENCKRALNVLKKHREYEEQAKWEQFLRLLKKKAKSEDNYGDLDDIPEDFLDPLTYGLMIDPVILPSS